MDNESLDPVAKDISKAIFANIEKVIDEVDLIVLSDYIISVLTPSLIKDIVKLANRHDKTVVMDPKGSDFQNIRVWMFLFPTWMKRLLQQNLREQNL